MDDIKVSICTLSYNQKDYIAQCLDGLLAQRCDFDYEILIHDDASTDGTADIIRDYASRYPDIIKPIFETENQFSKNIKNISGIFNFPRARGEYIAMCEGDDYWNDTNKLQLQSDYLDVHPQCSMCFTSAYQESTGVVISKTQMRPYEGDRILTPVEVINKTVSYPTASLMMRAELFKNLPDYYMQAPIGDIPMQLICASAEDSGCAGYIDAPLCTYRYMAPGSWTADMRNGDFKKKQSEYADQMKQMYESFDRHTGGRFHEAAEEAKNRLIFRTKVNVRDWNAIFAKENRQFLDELGKFEIFSLRFEKTCPNLYKNLQIRLVNRQINKQKLSNKQ